MLEEEELAEVASSIPWKASEHLLRNKNRMKASTPVWQSSAPRLLDQADHPKHRCTDYEKACHSVPHTQTLECLALYQTNSALRTFIQQPQRQSLMSP